MALPNPHMSRLGSKATRLELDSRFVLDERGGTCRRGPDERWSSGGQWIEGYRRLASYHLSARDPMQSMLVGGTILFCLKDILVFDR